MGAPLYIGNRPSGQMLEKPRRIVRIVKIYDVQALAPWIVSQRIGGLALETYDASTTSRLLGEIDLEELSQRITRKEEEENSHCPDRSVDLYAHIQLEGGRVVWRLVRLLW